MKISNLPSFLIVVFSFALTIQSYSKSADLSEWKYDDVVEYAITEEIISGHQHK